MRVSKTSIRCHTRSCTDDNTFFQKLQTHKWDVITFAPGACRFSGARQPIPGGNVETRGWSLLEYREKGITHNARHSVRTIHTRRMRMTSVITRFHTVKELQGAEIAIVETTQEAEMVPLLRQALDLPA